MTSTRSPKPLTPRPPGRFSKALIRMFMRPATVAHLELVAEGFYLITLESPEFIGVAWTPGEKVQIALGSVFTTRTYTPIEWDATAGRTRILAYVHGVGPGSDWVRGVKPGDACDIFGPRASLDLTSLPAPVVIFGDETAFGLALAAGQQGVQCLFEVNSAGAAQPVLERFGPAMPGLFPRRPGDSHLNEIEERLAGAAVSGASFVLTGKATSIQRLRQTLKIISVQGSCKWGSSTYDS